MELLIVFALLGLVGYFIGDRKGRGTAGFWLGFLLGVFGWVIAAFLKEKN